MASERRRRRDRVGDDLGALDARCFGHQHDAVREDDLRERLDVVGQRVVAALDERARLGGPQEHQSRPRAGAQLDAAVLARALQERDDVGAQRVGDVDAARGMEEEDDEMDDLHRHLFTVLMSPEWSHGVAAAVDVTLLGRFYERFADHAVAVARRVVFTVTGKMPTS